jgi:hypothetical protein
MPQYIIEEKRIFTNTLHWLDEKGNHIQTCPTSEAKLIKTYIDKHVNGCYL